MLARRWLWRYAFYTILCMLGAVWVLQYRLRRTAIPAGMVDAPLGEEELQEVLAVLRQPGFRGDNARPRFKDMILVADLPHKHRPGDADGHGGGRLVLVGDVHGQRKQLEALLDQIEFRKDHDHLVLAGDFIAKGPDSEGVIDLAMKLGASAVRGNHEDRIITSLEGLEFADDAQDATQSADITDTPPPPREGNTDPNIESKEVQMARSLGRKRLHWLKELPVILRLGSFGHMGQVVVVHAGLAPGVKLQDQDPTMVMNMRSMDKHGVPSKYRQGLPWTKVWNKFQHSFPAKDRMTVIYAHDQKRGLQVHDYSYGLDTGCISGGQLTAMIIEGDYRKPSHRIAQVDC